MVLPYSYFFYKHWSISYRLPVANVAQMAFNLKNLPIKSKDKFSQLKNIEKTTTFLVLQFCKLWLDLNDFLCKTKRLKMSQIVKKCNMYVKKIELFLNVWVLKSLIFWDYIFLKNKIFFAFLKLWIPIIGYSYLRV